MQKLISENHVLLSESVLRKLGQNRINTVLEFLHEDSEKISNLTKLSLPQVLEIRSDFFRKYSGLSINGATLVSKFSKKCVLKTGIPSLDDALGGGIPCGFISEICGLADSGKTQLCHQIAINSVINTGNKVLYIDTKGDFSAVRVQKILASLGLSHKDMAMIMHDIRIFFIWTMEELIELLRKIKNKILVIENLSLIIIDSLPCLMFQHLGDSNKIGLAYLNMMVNYSRYICDNFNVAFVCVNIQTRWIDQDICELEDEERSILVSKETYLERKNRCLGKYWQHIPVTVVILEKGYMINQPVRTNSEMINVNVIRNNNLECNHSLSLTLNHLGLT
ncbi:DNA repair protein RAD51 homolog 4 [Amyelois transitella]|uniref:DNA repair protein RAD51 homolog 4 n=1 Tax=Amyelois transitella TaxID=680683 RepID=UPI00067CF1CC|nr:DNA repair protein RAD51 homolog 4 [Amyelois transitella]